jgi:long-chain acyl-CoA synthetase
VRPATGGAHVRRRRRFRQATGRRVRPGRLPRPLRTLLSPADLPTRSLALPDRMPRLLPDLLRETASRHPDRQAISADGSVTTFRELDAFTDAIATTLQRMGLGERRIGLLLPNGPFFAALLHGVLRAGASAVMMNPLYSGREADEALEDAECGTVLTARALLPLLPTGTRALLVEHLPIRFVEVRSGVERGIRLEQGRVEATGRPDDEAVVVFTAAVEGRARGARLSHANLLTNAASTVDAMRLTAEDRVAGVLPYIHLFGQTVTLNAPIGAGACMVPVERFSPVRLLETLEAERVTILCGVPGIFAGLLAAAERRGPPSQALRVAICGGSPLPLEVGRRWEEVFGIPLREGYGLTEAGPVCLFNRVDRPNRRGTLGDPFPAVDVSIRDVDGSDLPAGEVGEICVRGPNVFLGYIGEGARTGREFHDDWLRTGDLGSVEPNGAIRYRGLLKPMFTRNGFNVYPAEVARVLESDPRIEAVRVCALPDAVKENEIVLVVRPARDAKLAEDDVRALCRERLAIFKQPARVEIEAPANAAH